MIIRHKEALVRFRNNNQNNDNPHSLYAFVIRKLQEISQLEMKY